MTAQEVFHVDGNVCVLLAAPGGGKSALLRAKLADSASSWLEERGEDSVPVLVSAKALIGADPLPEALAKAVAYDLKFFGLTTLTADLFCSEPRPGTPWLVLVDALDEIPDVDTRKAILQMLVNVAESEPELYRFVVASRPLPLGELDTLGKHVPRFELQPFDPAELHAYATRWFHSLDDPSSHAQHFTTACRDSGLDVLAQTPLMASMLCQLYVADPALPLPDGRTGAYRAFIELVYEQNSHKRIAGTQSEAIHRLGGRYQIVQHNKAVTQAAQAVHEHLPELIDYLAYERINGSRTPTVAVLASHPHGARPTPAKEGHWYRFLGDLLRPTGLLAQHGDDFDFLHQTLLEYHAARYATRDEQSSTQVLQALFPSASDTENWEPPDLAPSYMGFLLDRLLSTENAAGAATAQALQRELARGGTAACQFLTQQVRLTTKLPRQATAEQLTRFADGTAQTFLGRGRVGAAMCLAGLASHREEGSELLVRLAHDTSLDGYQRVLAALSLAFLVEHNEEGAELLAGFANEATMEDHQRVLAVRGLAGLAGHKEEGAELLVRLTNDTAFDARQRVTAAKCLAGLANHSEEGAELLVRLTNDTTLDQGIRLDATKGLAGLAGHEDEGAELLVRLTNDTALSDFIRVDAANALARLAGYEHEGSGLLMRFANDTTLDGAMRVKVAKFLAGLSRHSEDGAELLTRLANDTTMQDHARNAGHGRVEAAKALAGLAGQEEVGAAVLTRIANDITLQPYTRVESATALAGLTRHREDGEELLTRLANDTTLDGYRRVEAAVALAQHGDRGAELLVRIANDTTFNGYQRVKAADGLAGLTGHKKNGIALLTRFATTTLESGARVEAATALGFRGHWEKCAGLLARFVFDYTLDAFSRESAARDLAFLHAFQEEGGAGFMARIGDNTDYTSREIHGRMLAAKILAELNQPKPGGAG
ncbi:NACHT domain-containing protein [Streptomyces sp. NPDC002159]